jgi:ATP-dependent DNA ligase
LLLRRHGLTDPWRIGHARRWCPLRYVLFDLLYHRGRRLLHQPLARRRQALAAACAELQAPDVLFSVGVVGQGQASYAAAVARGQEGVMAKHLAAPYRPGRRSTAWRKIKPGRSP